MSGPTTDGKTVLSAIDDFDRKASVPQKTSANFAVLKGYHVSDCSDNYGTFSSALVKTIDVERKTAAAEIRPENFRYHDTYNRNCHTYNLRIKQLQVISRAKTYSIDSISWQSSNFMSDVKHLVKKNKTEYYSVQPCPECQ